MIKKVNVYPVYPILTIRTPIYHTTLNMELNVGDIERCIFARAKVEEVLPDGKLLVLNLKNYNKCNFVEEHNNKSVVSLPENKICGDTTMVVEEFVGEESEVKEAAEVQVENLETISPIEVEETEEEISEEEISEEETSEVEENLVVDNNNRKNKKHKK